MEGTVEADLCFPHLLNSSCRKQKIDPTERLISDVLLSVASVVTCSLNLLVIVSIAHFRQLHSPTNIILLSLAVSDFLVGLMVMPVEGLKWRVCWIMGDFLCALYFLFSIAIVVASVGTIVLISVDRFMAICDPLRYPTRMNVKVASISVCVCWSYAFIYATFLSLENFKHFENFKSCYGECAPYFSPEVDMIMSFILPVSIIVVLYTRVFIVAVSHARAMRSQVKHLTSQTDRKSEIKAAKKLGSVVLLYLMCYCPFYCVVCSKTNITVLGTPLFVIVISLLFLNSCLNPLVYTFLYPWFRKSIEIIITLQILRPGSCNTKML